MCGSQRILLHTRRRATSHCAVGQLQPTSTNLMGLFKLCNYQNWVIQDRPSSIHRCIVNLLRHSEATHLIRHLRTVKSVNCIILRFINTFLIGIQL